MRVRRARLLGLIALGGAIASGGCLFPSLDAFVGAADPSAADASGSDAATDGGTSDGATCDADLSGDPRNCGACQHDCLDGTCANGACEAFDFVNVAAPTDVIADELGVYIASAGDAPKILFVSHDGATTRTIASGALVVEPAGLAVAGGRIYWTNEGTRLADGAHASGSGSIASAKLDGTDARVVVGALDAPRPIGTNGSALVFGTRGTCATSCAANDGTIVTCGLPECAQPLTLATTELGPERLVVSATSVAWIVDPKSSDRPTRTASLTAAGAADIGGAAGASGIALAPNGRDLYVTTGTDVRRVPVAGPVVSLALRLEGPRAIAADDRDVFWLDFSFAVTPEQGGIYSIPTGSFGDLDAVRQRSRGAARDALALTPKAAYFTWISPSGEGRVRKLVR